VQKRRERSRSHSFADPGIELLKQLGIRHEQAYLHALADHHGTEIVEISTDIPWAEAIARTIDAMHRGVSAIYQATFERGDWGGRSDFLVRVAEACALGPWSYEVVETKLARSTKARALIQLCFYSDLLSIIQRLDPQWMHVVLGGGPKPESFRVMERWGR
jgi:predicted RecB family nuclease